MLSKIAATLLIGLPHCMAMRRGIAAGYKMLELAFDIREQSRGAEAKQRGRQPVVAQFLLDQDQIRERLLRGTDAAGRLESDLNAGTLGIVADGARHH